MAHLILSICVILGLGASSVSAMEDWAEMYPIVMCRRLISRVFWEVMALQAKMMAMLAVGVPQSTLASLSDSLKGSGYILDAVLKFESDGNPLPKEAVFQLNQWCITYPVQVGTVLGNLASRYPDFARAFSKLITELQKRADELTIKMTECQPPDRKP